MEEGGGLAAEAGGGAEATLRSGEADNADGADVAGGVDDAGAANEADDTGGEDDAGEADDAGDVDDAEEAAAAEEVDSAEEGDEVDDAGKREKDEHAARIGISAIAAAAAPKRRAPPRPAIHPSTPTRRHPIMPHLYQAPGVNHKVRSARRKRSPGSRSGVWRNLVPAVLYR